MKWSFFYNSFVKFHGIKWEAQNESISCKSVLLLGLLYRDGTVKTTNHTRSFTAVDEQ